MDWSSIKTKLIIILLSINIFLLVFFFYNKADKSLHPASDETLKELEARLGQIGIGLDTEIPKKVKEMKPLIVQYQEYNPEEINNNFFQGQGQIVVQEDITKIINGKEEVTIINNRRFLYENFGKNPIYKDIDNKKNIRNLLLSWGFDTEDMVLISKEESNKTISFEFAKRFDDLILETSYTRITVEDGKVVTLDRLWVEAIEKDNKKIIIDPAYKSLFTILNREDLKGETIKSIELCYYFNPEEQGLLEDNTKAEMGRAIPAWRILFKSGKRIIVDNY